MNVFHWGDWIGKEFTGEEGAKIALDAYILHCDTNFVYDVDGARDELH